MTTITTCGNLRLDLGNVHKCGRVKPVSGPPFLLSYCVTRNNIEEHNSDSACFVLHDGRLFYGGFTGDNYSLRSD